MESCSDVLKPEDAIAANAAANETVEAAILLTICIASGAINGIVLGVSSPPPHRPRGVSVAPRPNEKKSTVTTCGRLLTTAVTSASGWSCSCHSTKCEAGKQGVQCKSGQPDESE